MIRKLQILALALSGLVLAAAATFLILESTWAEPKELGVLDSFLLGTTGCEIMPLPALVALPKLFPEHFQPGGEAAGDWIDQFGFIRGTPGVNEGLPQGFALSNYRPRTGAPSSVPFVGINCSLCHSSRITRSPGDRGVVVLGMGSLSLDFIAWVDAYRSSILDERLTVDAIVSTYETASGKSLGPLDRMMIGLWLAGTRRFFDGNQAKYDAPYGGPDLHDARFMPNGPSRTQPFRNLVRNILDRPAATDRAFGKFPALYEQKHREWGQFDGSVRSRVTRSVLAALAVGATQENLIFPDITGNVVRSIEHTLELKGPDYEEVFKPLGVTLDRPRAERGRTVYRQHCFACHGDRAADGGWTQGPKQEVVFAATELGLDPERVEFRYYDELGQRLVDHFDEKNPLRPKLEDIRPGPLGNTHGYISYALTSVWSRAPFFHNGSIPTLAEVIQLKPRRQQFYRGGTLYDPVDVGVVAPPTRDARNYYRYDATLLGNSNAGHDYPWAYGAPGWDEAALTDLLEYLKTL
jgi:hypothetical protein